MKKFHGLIVPILTPVDKNGDLDKEAFIRLSQDIISRGADGLYVTGTTGEASQLKDSTWHDVNRLAIELYGDSDTAVYSGAVFPGTLETIERIHQLEDMGAKAVFATPTFYNTDGSQEQVVKHFERICQSTPLDVVVYSISYTTHVEIHTETLSKIAQLHNIIGVKDTRGDWGTHLENIRALKDTQVGIAVVPETMMAASLLMGADAIVTAAGNFMPEYYADILKAAYEHDFDGVMASFDRILYLDHMMRCEGGNGVAKLKYLGWLLGLMQPYPSMSTMDVTPQAKETMERVAAFIRAEKQRLYA